MLTGREAKPGELVPHIVYKDQELKAGQEFVPDEFIVKAIVTTQDDKSNYAFKHCDFPSDGNEMYFRNHMRTYASEPYHLKLSDFGLLIFMARTFGLPLTTEVCQALRTKQPFNKDLIAALDRAIMAKELF